MAFSTAAHRRLCFPQLRRAPSKRTCCLVVGRNPTAVKNHTVGNRKTILKESPPLPRCAKSQRGTVKAQACPRPSPPRKQTEQVEDVLRRLAATGSKAKG